MEERLPSDSHIQSPGASSLIGELESARRELARRTRDLQRSEDRFRDVIERNADAIVVVGRQGRIRFANAAAAQLFRARREALIGADFGFPLVANETTEIELRTAADGSERTAEMRAVVSEWEGDEAHIATLRDITERKRSEQTAQALVREQTGRAVAEKSARRFRFLAESSALLASSLDLVATLKTLAHLCVSEIADWSIIYCVDDSGELSRVEIAHHDPGKTEILEAIREMPVDRRAGSPVVDALRTRRSLLVREVTPASLHDVAGGAPYLWPGGQLDITSYMIVPIVGRDRALGAITLVCSDPRQSFDEHDLTLAEDLAARAALAIDNTKLYEAAQRANQEKTDFLAVISHDLRTPLNAVLGYAELLDMGVSGQLDAESRQRVGRIRTSANHLLYLINELLAYARLDGGAEKLTLRETDIRMVLLEVKVIMEPRAAEHGLSLQVELPPESLIVRTDPDKLRQVLLNLAGNAVRYTVAGEVRILAREEGEHRLAIEVRDTGIGIAPSNIKHVFEPFWQVDQTQRSRGEGTGLGLSIVRRLTDLLGGKVEVRSEPGRGSTFRLQLPRNLDHRDPAATD